MTRDKTRLVYLKLETRDTNLGGGKDVLDGLGDLGANAITLDQADQEVALVSACTVSDHRDTKEWGARDEAITKLE
jgi:hypothetical protein